MLALLEKIGGLLPTETRRSETSQALQQFSTPLELAYVAAYAAGIRSDDLVLEPSAGTGMLAVQAEVAGARLALNEWAEDRNGLLKALFPKVTVTRHDGAQIHDRLDQRIHPNVILMNPPFSASPLIEGRHPNATFEHIRSALSRLEPRGRLVTITGESFSPYGRSWRSAFEKLQATATLVATIPMRRGFFRRHGTDVESRLTVFDKVPATKSDGFPVPVAAVQSLQELLERVEELVRPRIRIDVPAEQPAVVALPPTTPATPSEPVALPSTQAPRLSAFRRGPLPQAVPSAATETAHADIAEIAALPRSLPAPNALNVVGEGHDVPTIAVPAREGIVVFSASQPAALVGGTTPDADTTQAVTALAPSSAPSAIIELGYAGRDWSAPSAGALEAGLYEPYTVQSIVIEGAKPHPTVLVQSAAMASVAPPKPGY